MTELRTEGFHHVTKVSADIVRTARFYRDLLGLRLVKRTVNFDDPLSWHLYFGLGDGEPGTLLTFFEWPGAARGRPGIGGIHHTALGVEDEAALLMWKRWLTDRGVHVGGPFDRRWFTSIYFTDPDGQVVEIATRGPGYTVDEPAHALGEREIHPGEERIRGARDEAEIRDRTHPEPIEEIAPRMALTGIHHVSGITDDVESAHRFFTEGLGLRRVKRTVNQDDPSVPHHFWARYDGETVAEGSSMTLFGWSTRAARARSGAGQTHHVAFRARDLAEQKRWRDRLGQMGVPVTGVMDRSYFTSIYFRAPDGLLLEIATDGPGFTVDEDPGRLGATLQLPEWLEPRRREIMESLTPLPD